MDGKLFDALCDLCIYHYCDLRRPKTVGARKFAQSVRLLKQHGIIEDREDAGSVWERYDGMVEEYALDQLPGHIARYDYWGAKIITNDTGWNSPKTGLFAGDSAGHYMFFDSFEAMEQYANELTPTLTT